MKIKCPNCKKDFELKREQAAAALGSISTPKKTLGARMAVRKRWENARLRKELEEAKNKLK